MINDRALSGIAAQTSLSYFMENKWRKITFIFFPHVFKKKICKFQEEMAQRKQIYINYLYIHVEMHAEVFPSDLCIDLHLQLLLL